MAFTEVNGVRLWYKETGEASPWCISTAPASATSISRRRRRSRRSTSAASIDFDMRGYGQSDKPNPVLRHERLGRRRAGLMDALGIERAHIHGTSMGGMIAQDFAARHADRDRLVINCAAAKLDLAGRLTFQNWIDIAEAYGCGSRTLAELIAVQALSRRFLDGPDGPAPST